MEGKPESELKEGASNRDGGLVCRLDAGGEAVKVGRWDIDPVSRRVLVRMSGSVLTLHLRLNRRKAEAIGLDGSLSLFNFEGRKQLPTPLIVDLKLTRDIEDRGSISQTTLFYLGTKWLWFEEQGGMSVCKSVIEFGSDNKLRVSFTEKQVSFSPSLHSSSYHSRSPAVSCRPLRRWRRPHPLQRPPQLRPPQWSPAPLPTLTAKALGP